MYYSNLFGLVICIFVLTRSKCAAQECRDIAAAQYCQRVKKNCGEYGIRQAAPHISKYCRKTCGLCGPAQQQPIVKKEIKCVDKPICERLTALYKITSCGTLKRFNRRLWARAMKKCPKLCGVCVPETIEVIEPQVIIPKIKRPVVYEVENAKETVKTSTSRNRPPHPPIEDRETDEEPRRGVFYIFTKYLSL